jgi:hypothetical protein
VAVADASFALGFPKAEEGVMVDLEDVRLRGTPSEGSSASWLGTRDLRVRG